MVKGVVRTRVGYAGGTKKDPTYHSLGGHAETIQIDFDPSVISYDELLGMFWKMHSPRMRVPSAQYRSIVFYHNDNQRQAAERLKADEGARMKAAIFTEVVPFTEFYRAEDYHQKYYLRDVRELAAEYLAIYPDIADFVGSTATARVNGYASHYGTKEQLEKELNSLGLSEESQRRLLKIVGS